MNLPTPMPTSIHLYPDNSRVLVRPFIPADPSSLQRILTRALDASEEEIEERLSELRFHFSQRHSRLESAWLRHYSQIQAHIHHESSLSSSRRLYIGALFSGEYALESAALFNPSIVLHPDQSGLVEGELRFVMSLRATGEGHISSIVFRTGVITSDYTVTVDDRSKKVSAPELHPNPSFRRTSFFRKLASMELDTPWIFALEQSLGDQFTRRELNEALHTASGKTRSAAGKVRRTLESIHWLADANYEVNFDPAIPLSERVIFPVVPHESNGMEDARFVRFTDDDGTVCYYATYTAYNGRSILPQLLETSDFLTFRSATLNGASVRNKGMALFPRRINGEYVMISRQDDENLYIMRSADLHRWEDSNLMRRPTEPWEAVKIGNCGSPIETPSGWILLTHGVGPMRRYCIGALLLDLEDPSIVLGHLKFPLLEPDEPVRNGYVPNVVYSCGALTHGERLVLPYGLSDTSISVCTIDLSELIRALNPQT